MTTAPLTETLLQALREAAPPTVCVGYSGGPDSTALLHALAQLPEARRRGLRALHVDHGLQGDSLAWAKHCAGFCQSIDVPLNSIRVSVHDAQGEGIEAAARRARYTAFAEQLHDGEWLALAHHRDDQVETVLLKLLRGAGPEGLGGMRSVRPFACGILWRPLLDTPRETLRDYLMHLALPRVDDPANTDPRFARNVLRREIMPRITAHWPHADTAILHTARLCRNASDYINDQARITTASLRRRANTLDAPGWLALPEALRAAVLDTWLHTQGLPAPPDASRNELEQQARNAADDRVPSIAWPNAEVRVWDARLHAMSPLPALPDAWLASWGGESLALPADGGSLELVSAEANKSLARVTYFNPPLSVQLRRGGERIKPVGDPHTRELRDLFQQARMPPWLRARCPLIFLDDELIAVADLWISERGRTVFDACGLKPHWVCPAHLSRDAE
ncbi:MAG TPA: tRNA lysidine(34) synthetase TilS [Rhodanobacteraceae bacterium]